MRGPDRRHPFKLLVGDADLGAAEGLEDRVAVEDDVGPSAGKGLDLVGVLVVDLLSFEFFFFFFLKKDRVVVR